MRPTCINYGCDSLVTYSRRNHDGTYRWRIHCSHCQAASYGKWLHRYGVLPFKQGVCSNKNGALNFGFDCPTDFSKLPKGANGLTEIDHINGDHSDNSPQNLQELCMTCHKIKGQLFGDFDNTKSKKASSYKSTVNGCTTFSRLFEIE